MQWVCVCVWAANCINCMTTLQQNWTVNKSRPKLIAYFWLYSAIQKCRKFEEISQIHIFTIWNVVTRFTSCVPTVSSGAVAVPYSQSSTCIHLAINCTRGHPFSFRAAQLCAAAVCVCIYLFPCLFFVNLPAVDLLAAPLFNLQNVN